MTENYLFKYGIYFVTKTNEIEIVVRNRRSIPSNHPGRNIEMGYEVNFNRRGIKLSSICDDRDMRQNLRAYHKQVN